MYKYQVMPVQGSLPSTFQTVLDTWSAEGWRLAGIIPEQDGVWAILIFEKEARDYQKFVMSPEQYRKMYLNEWDKEVE